MNFCKLYVVRHGQSEANRDHIVSGRLDSPLTTHGTQQAQETKSSLKDIKFATAYSSDLQRALKTTEIIFGSPVPKENRLSDLRERTFGHLEGQPDEGWKEIYKDFERTYSNLPTAKKWKHRYAPDIESNGELSTRFMASIRGIGTRHIGETILIGTHAGCVRTTLIALGYAPESKLPPDSFSNSAYILLSFDGQKFTIEKVAGVALH